MKIVIFGASGMVGGGLLLEALKDADVTEVIVVGRSPVGVTHAKLLEVLVSDLAEGAREISGMDACFFTVGVTASGKNEAEYTRLTYDLTLSVAEALVERNPAMTFVYVSGQGTGGKAMWARVKRRTEDALLAMPFRAAYMFRPGFIVPVGVKSKTKLYQRMYTVMGPVLPLIRKMFPKSVVNSDELGRAMLKVAKSGFTKKVLETSDIAGLRE
ncbi:NAD-dependent epimerase/dehydratase family protein [Terriglobus saanensis]|uniref:NAD-dependent epimerase/dehydratase n=1 Tax=Terriglobus saanensis (strain ATCC BAA-1853 / DSM 23119 / SP1PR4) TaxID=401053 RepID=E8V1I7_TERSS|nr:NAD-dependent epimerase/dehydratase family protein [Terriglobus saanensis]ADV81182.1 NAD-dependent epimerase/dehydratase [Terriglobus saanensis SP1PR4]